MSFIVIATLMFFWIWFSGYVTFVSIGTPRPREIPVFVHIALFFTWPVFASYAFASAILGKSRGVAR